MSSPKSLREKLSISTPTTPVPSAETPKPPLSPPRRRSSLAFSNILPQFSSSRVANNASPRNTNDPLDSPSRNVPNTSRKRTTQQPTVTSPGHVARMQRLFQDARANFRFDLRFASSAMGSIESRLPPKDTVLQDKDDGERQAVCKAGSNVVQNWRYSTIPTVLADHNTDVREPFPEMDLVLQLPEVTTGDSMAALMSTVEPLSSGFNSPIDRALQSELPDHLQRDDAPQDVSSHDSSNGTDQFKSTATNIDRPMSELKVATAEDDFEGTHEDDSPIVNHLRRRSASNNLAIFLSAPARAAADSARLKRCLLHSNKAPSNEKDLQEPGAGSSRSSSSATRSASSLMVSIPKAANSELICPDPDLHYLTDVSRRHRTMITPSPRASHSLDVYYTRRSSPRVVNRPFRRVNARGSPMPFARPKQYAQGFYGGVPGQVQQAVASTHNASAQGPGLAIPNHQGDVFVMADEHFKPGWLFSDGVHSPPRNNPMTNYSFSTAAAKLTGSSAAPDLRIRDSYRTDTLTPLARPPTRYRKNGLGAELRASNGQHCGPMYSEPIARCAAPSTRTPAWMASRFIQPRVRLPLASENARRGHKDPRRTPHVHHDKDSDQDPIATNNPSSTQAGSDIDILEIDEDTRAAVRMSFFGAELPQDQTEVKELSPNVTTTRKKTRKKPVRKHRPSYWDDDLEEIQRSPARRSNTRDRMSPARGNKETDALMKSMGRCSGESGGLQDKENTDTQKENPSSIKHIAVSHGSAEEDNI